MVRRRKIINENESNLIIDDNNSSVDNIISSKTVESDSSIISQAQKLLDELNKDYGSKWLGSDREDRAKLSKYKQELLLVINEGKLDLPVYPNLK